MFNAGTIQAAIQLNIQQFTKALQSVMGQARQAGQQVQQSFSQMSQHLNSSAGAANQLNGEFKNMERIVGGILLSQTFYQATNAIQEATANVVKFSNNMEQAQISMTYLLGDAQKAAGFIKNMQNFASETSFDTQSAMDLSRKLLNANFQAESIRGIMARLNDANAVAGASPEILNRIVYAMTQMKTNGKIMGGELRQLAEAGIPIYDMLAQKLGMAKEELYQIGELKINGDIGVAALLDGLERFNGAAEKMAKTVPGLWQSISDNSLIMSQKVFEQPYGYMKTFLTRWRDTWQKARDIMVGYVDDTGKQIAGKGLGGVFEAFVPKDLQEPIRMIAASLISLGQSFLMLGKLMAPVVSTINTAFIQAVGAAIPVVAAVVRQVVNFASIAMQSSPAVKYLAAVIGTLVVASVAAKSLLFLWNVTRMGAICVLVADAVKLLTTAIRGLFLVLTRNPIVAVLMIIAGALLYFAMQSRTVIQWLDALTAKLGQLGGFDVGKTLVPKDDNINKWAEEYNKTIEDLGGSMNAVTGKTDGITDSTNGAADAAKGATKEFKKFLASFDEVFQVPEQDVSKALDGIANTKIPTNMGLPDPKIPVLPKLPDKIKMPKFEWQKMDPPPWWTWIPELTKPINIKINWPKPPNFPPPNAFATVWQTTMNAIRDAANATANALEGLGGAIGKWMPQLNPAPVLLPGIGALLGFGNALQGVRDSLGGFVGDIGKKWNDFWQTFPSTVATGLMSLPGRVRDGLVNTRTALGDSFGGFAMDWAVNWGKLAPMLGTAIAPIAGLISAGVANWGDEFVSIGATISKGWNDAWSGLTGTVSSWIQPIQTAITLAVGSFQMAFDLTGMTDKMKEMWDEAQKLLIGGFVAGLVLITGGVAGWIGGLGASAEAGFASVGTMVTVALGGIGTTIALKFTNLKETVTNKMTELGTSWGTKWEELKTNTSKFFTDTGKTMSTNFNNWKTGITTWFADTKKSWSDGYNSLKEKTSERLSAMKKSWDTHKEDIKRTVSSTFLSTLKIFGVNLGDLFTKVHQWGPKVIGVFKTLGPGFSNAVRHLGSFFDNAIKGIPGLASKIVSRVGDAFRKLPGIIWSAIKSIPSKVRDIFKDIKLPSFSTVGEGVKATWHNVTGFASGGVINKDSIVRVGEGGRREAIVPMENAAAMAPFSDAVASAVASALSNIMPQQPQGGGQQVLYVGTLIADDRSLKELERKMKVIRLNESTRGVK